MKIIHKNWILIEVVYVTYKSINFDDLLMTVNI